MYLHISICFPGMYRDNLPLCNYFVYFTHVRCVLGSGIWKAAGFGVDTWETVPRLVGCVVAVGGNVLW